MAVGDDAQPAEADDGVCISEGQRRVHMRSEAGAVLVVAPMLTFIATRPRALTAYEKGALLGVAGLTLALDGSLYRRMGQAQRQEKAVEKEAQGRARPDPARVAMRTRLDSSLELVRTVLSRCGPCSRRLPSCCA